MDALTALEIVVEGTLLAQKIINVYHVINAQETDDEQVSVDLQDAMETALNYLTPQLVTGMSFDSMTIREVVSGAILNVIGLAITGEYDNDPLPPGVAALVTQPTAQAKTRGRKFIAGLGEGDSSGGLWLEPTLIDIAEYANSCTSPFLGTDSGNPYAWGVMDKLGVFRPFTGYVVSNVPAYQRRRKQGVGA